MQDKEIKLKDDDWETLFIVETENVGKHKIEIKPFTIDELPVVIKFVKENRSYFKKENITLENAFEWENLEKITNVISKEAPYLVAKATNIRLSDIRRLPLLKTFALVNKILKVNVEAQRGLEKNLLELLEDLTAQVTSLSAMSLTDSSSKDTNGEK